MPSAYIKRLDIAKESSYCNRGTGSASPTQPSTWIPCEFADASQIVAVGETTTTENGTGTGGFGRLPGQALIDAQTAAPVRKGTLTVDWLLRGDPTAQQTGLRLLLGTRLGYSSAVADILSSVSVSASGALTLTGSGGIGSNRPNFVGYSLPDGRISYQMGTNTSVSTTPTSLIANSFTAYTAEAMAPKTGGDDLICEWWQKSTGSELALTYTSTTRYTVALRITGDGWQQQCYGCSLTSLTISPEGDGRAIKMSCTIDCPYVIDIASPVTPSPLEIEDGPVLHSLGSPVLVGTTSNNLGWNQTPMCVAEWSVALNWTTAGSACGSYWQGRAPLEATDLDIQIDMTIGHDAAQARAFFAAKWQAGNSFPLLLPFGGKISSDDDEAYGGAIIIPAAYVKSGDVLIQDLSGDLVQTKVSLGATVSSTNNALPLFELGIF